MAGFNLLGRTGSLLHRALDAESLRFQVRAHNLANVNTPGYKRQDVEFETYLTAELDRRGCRAPQDPPSASGRSKRAVLLPHSGR